MYCKLNNVKKRNFFSNYRMQKYYIPLESSTPDLFDDVNEKKLLKNLIFFTRTYMAIGGYDVGINYSQHFPK